MRGLTLPEMRASDKEWLTPADVSRVLQCNPYTLNVTVNHGKTLPFPYLMTGRRLKIPRRAFIAWAEEMKLKED